MRTIIVTKITTFVTQYQIEEVIDPLVEILKNPDYGEEHPAVVIALARIARKMDPEDRKVVTDPLLEFWKWAGYAKIYSEIGDIVELPEEAPPAEVPFVLEEPIAVRRAIALPGVLIGSGRLIA